MDVLRIVSADVQALQSKPMLTWLAQTSGLSSGRMVKIQPVLSFLKGDTPQRAFYTSTTGPAGKRFCHACTAGNHNFNDRIALVQNRRSLSQWHRVETMMSACQTAIDMVKIRKATGYTSDAIMVKFKSPFFDRSPSTMFAESIDVHRKLQRVRMLSSRSIPYNLVWPDYQYLGIISQSGFRSADQNPVRQATSFLPVAAWRPEADLQYWLGKAEKVVNVNI